MDWQTLLHGKMNLDLSNLAKTLVHKIILVFMQQNIFREKLQEKGGKMLSPFLKFVMQSLENKVVTLKV